MQIFILHENPKINATYYVNRHVCKIQTEIAQCLSTVAKRLFNEKELPDFLYKSTHEKHPVVLWLSKTQENFIYGVNTGLALDDEYNFRYPNQKYKTEKRIFDYFKLLTTFEVIPNRGLTPFAQAIPEQYKSDDAVKSYRAYYIGEKSHLFKWAKRPVPEWITNKEV